MLNFFSEEKEDIKDLSDELEDDGEEGENAAKWKENMKLNAQSNFEKNKVVNWNNLIYGKEDKQNPPTVSDDDNDFFKV